MQGLRRVANYMHHGTGVRFRRSSWNYCSRECVDNKLTIVEGGVHYLNVMIDSQKCE